MFAVEIYAAIRRIVFVEGKSRRVAVRVFGLSRETVSKVCRYSVPPGYARNKASVSRAHCTRSAGRRPGIARGVPSVGLRDVHSQRAGPCWADQDGK